jgi:hypothetical protein
VRGGVLRKWEACLRPEASDSAIMRATTEPPWLVTPEKVHAVVGRLIEMAHPKQIILFDLRLEYKVATHPFESGLVRELKATPARSFSA